MRRTLPPGLALTASLLVSSCASSVEDLAPEIPRDAAGQPLPVIVEVRYYGTNASPALRLSNRSNRRVVALQRAGKLRPFHKTVPDEEMGRLIAFMRAKGFFRYATPVGNPPARLPSRTRRTVTYAVGSAPPLRMIQVYGMALGGRDDEVQAIVEIGRAINQIYNQTLSLTVDPRHRGVRDLLHQPALKKRTGAR